MTQPKMPSTDRPSNPAPAYRPLAICVLALVLAMMSVTWVARSRADAPRHAIRPMANTTLTYRSAFSFPRDLHALYWITVYGEEPPVIDGDR